VGEAQRWLQRAQAIEPQNAKIAVQLAALAVARGDRARAIALLERAVAVDASSDQARANLALLLFQQGPRGYARALALARKAAHMRPLKHHNQLTLGVVALNVGRVKEAEQALLRAQALRPTHAQTLYNLALLVARRGERERAMALCRQALAHRPGLLAARRLLEALRAGLQVREPAARDSTRP